MITVADKLKEQIETLSKQRKEIESVLVDTRTVVIGWLESVFRSCQREVYHIKETGDIADREIQTPWELLQESIARLRQVQELMRTNSDILHDTEEELAEAKNPF